ncbi:MAG: hypothetical protein EBS55_04395 [Flavobacteriaceae bacterium]|nr:hypothetical protein [Flavobacteriaceae bacterium]
MKVYLNRLLVSLLLLFAISQTYAQSIPVGTIGDEYLRILQLQGKIDPKLSFTTRPNFLGSKLNTDSFYSNLDSSLVAKKLIQTRFFEFKPILAQIRTQYNSMQPFGWNDEGMIKAKGIQTLARVGVYTRVGPLHVQFMPEHVNAENPVYDISPEYGSVPKTRYEQNFLGQSSVRLNLSAVSVGFSNENLYWGPGQFGALIMSNNAPGFAHYTFNTTRPIKGFLGSLEFQLVTGRLEQDPNAPFESMNLKSIPEWNGSRIFNGLNIVFQPSIFPNLFVGINRAYQYSEVDIDKQGNNFVSQFIPVFSKFFKSNVGRTNEDKIPRDQQISLYTRWLFPKSHAEFYLEYGWNDHKDNFRDFWIDPEHSTSYLIGFKKLKPLNQNRWLELNTEIIQMAQSTDYLTRQAGDWYTYPNGGYNHFNQILGAGSGKGNNIQTLNISLLNGLSKIGLKIHRIQHQPTLAEPFLPLETLGLRPLRWTDIGVGFIAQKHWKNIILTPEVNFVNSMNYAWTFRTNFNFFAQLNLTYLW